jgi:hypothetical protein
MDSLELLRRDWDSEGKAFPDKKLCPLRQRSVNDRNYFGPCYGENVRGGILLKAGAEFLLFPFLRREVGDLLC